MRLRDLLTRYLAEQGFEVRAIADARELDKRLQRDPPHLVVLDLMLPGEDGLAVCRRLRGAGETVPIIMLTAKGEDVDRIVGLEMGADDYLPKPFNPRELVARIHAVLRRHGERAAPGTPSAEGRVPFGPFVLDHAARTLSRDGETTTLTTGEYALVKVLLQHPRQPLAREKLMMLARGRDHEVFDRAIDVQVSRLRKLVEPDPSSPRYIQTVWGFGYVYVPDDAASEGGSERTGRNMRAAMPSGTAEAVTREALAVVAVRPARAAARRRARAGPRDDDLRVSPGSRRAAAPAFRGHQDRAVARRSRGARRHVAGGSPRAARAPCPPLRRAHRACRRARAVGIHEPWLAPRSRPAGTGRWRRSRCPWRRRSCSPRAGRGPRRACCTRRRCGERVAGQPARCIRGVLAQLEARFTEALGPGIEMRVQSRTQTLWVRLPAGSGIYWIGFPLPPRPGEGGEPSRALLISGALALALIIAAFIFARYLAAPLRQLESAVARVGRGETPQPLPESGPSEIAAVNRGFNTMLANLRQIEHDRALLLAGVSHDLRTPLARLRLGLELANADPATRQGMVADIEEMDRVIGQFLDFARGEQGAALEIARPQCTREGRRRALCQQWARRALRARRARAVRDASDGDHAPHRQPGRQRARLWRAAGRDPHVDEPGVAILEVADRGPGIAANDVERLKQPFTRATDSRARDDGAPGAGLGLAIVDRIARLHGGRFDLVPRDGGGTIARVTLPTSLNSSLAGSSVARPRLMCS